MKKFLAIVLMFCLAAVCVPAGAESPSARDVVATPSGILDLSAGSISIIAPVDPTTEQLNEVYATELMQAFLSIQFAAMDPSGVKPIDSESYQRENDYCSAFSLDGDDTVDLYMKQTTSDGNVLIFCEPAATCSCGAEYKITASAPATYVPFTMRYYQELTVVFSSAVSDSTGTYTADRGEAVFEKPAKKNPASVKIPDTVTVSGKVLPVTKIADYAFKNQKKLTKVTVGANIKEIGKGAFQNCAKLKSVSGGKNVEIIGDFAFSGCKALKSFTIGAKVTQIGKKAFNKCAALKKITIKTKLLTAKTVGSGAFKGIHASATIKVPKAVKKDYSKWLLKKGVKKTMKIK